MYGNKGSRIEGSVSMYGNKGSRIEGYMSMYGNKGSRIEGYMSMYGNKGSLVRRGEEGPRGVEAFPGAEFGLCTVKEQGSTG